jgi:hypothetical protein
MSTTWAMKLIKELTKRPPGGESFERNVKEGAAWGGWGARSQEVTGRHIRSGSNIKINGGEYCRIAYGARVGRDDISVPAEGRLPHEKETRNILFVSCQ